jgi:hypothetical protein
MTAVAHSLALLAALAAPAQPPEVPTTSVEVPAWTRHLTVGGGAILWYYQPFLEGAKNNLQVFFANIVLDADLGHFGFHAEPRIRNTKLRPFFEGPAWMQEVYARATVASESASLVIKAGKEYSHFGLFWDNSFYGNVQVYDGLKLDPDYGLRAWGQFFVIDGQTNVSLPGRDTFSIPGARRRNHGILRLEPFLTAGPALVKLGLSGAFLQADLPVVGTQDVWRGAADVTATLRGLTLWGEYIRQNGQSVTEFPIAATPATATTPEIPGQASRHNDYVLAGAEYLYRSLSARYVFSLGNYGDLDVRETMHVPSLGVSLDPGLSLLAELVIWERRTPEAHQFVDRSLNVTLYGHF